MIDLKHEIERELGLIDPPDLWDRIQADASHTGEAVLDLTTPRHRRRPSLWLAVAAVAACLAVVALATDLMSDSDSVDATDPSEPSPPITGGGEQQPLMLVNQMQFIDGPLAGGTLHLDVQGSADDVATGTLRFDQVRDGMTITVDCVDTDTETAAARFVVFGGEVTTPPDDGTSVVGDPLFLVVRMDAPAQGTVGGYSVTLADSGGSCSEFLDSAPAALFTDERNWSTVSNGFDGPRILATREDVLIGGAGGLRGPTLNINAFEEDGEVTGEFRVNDVVVTLRCAGTEYDGRDLILAGELTADPDDEAEVYADLGDLTHEIRLGDLLLLIIRDGERVAFLADENDAASCSEFVDSVPYNLDGGYFTGVPGIETDLPGGGA